MKKIRNLGIRHASALSGRSTFGELLDDWLAQERQSCKASTYAAYAQRAELHLRPLLGGVRLKHLSAEHYEKLCRTLEPLAPATQRGVVCVLRQVLEHGRKSGVKIDMDAPVPRWQAETKPVTVLDELEVGRLEAALQAEYSLRGLGLRLCLYTGLRLGEICALRWEDLSPDARELQVRRTAQRLRSETPGSRTQLRLDSPKSGSSVRRVPIPEALAAELQVLRCPDECYLLTGRSDRFMDPRTYQVYFRRILKSAGIRTVNFHILRHTFATRCIDLGLDPKSLSRVLGHADVSTTLNIYVHPDQRRLRECQERMMALFPPA